MNGLGIALVQAGDGVDGWNSADHRPRLTMKKHMTADPFDPKLDAENRPPVQTPPEQESRETLSKRDFIAFHAAINGAFTPNAALQGAIDAAAKVKRA